MIKVLILIGGKSLRMGEDKYLLQYNGKPQFQYLHDLVVELDIPVYLSCNERQESLIGEKYAKIIDIHDSIGPIGGISAAVRFDPEASWLVISCDLIHLRTSHIQALIQSNDENFDVVTYRKAGEPYYETTFSIYNPGSFIILKRQIRSGKYSLQELLKKCAVKAMEVSDVDFLKNINTRADLDQ